MLFALIGALVLGAGAVYWHVYRRPAAAGSNPPAPRVKEGARAKEGGRFAAVQIRPRLEACRAAQAIEGVRYLAKDAPALPLPKCTEKKTCSCVFSKLRDRRTGGRRRATGGLRGTLLIAAKRRNAPDHRRRRVRR